MQKLNDSMIKYAITNKKQQRVNSQKKGEHSSEMGNYDYG